MKSFSPAGLANKALYGYDRTTGRGAKTFGNPDGNISGNGAYAAGGGGGGGPPPLVPHLRNAVATLDDVAFAGGVWVAVGANEFWRSTDGKIWTLVHSVGAAVELTSVTRGSATVWAVMGNDTGLGQIVAYTSPDGILWTQQTVTPTAHQQPIGLAFGNGLFLGDDTPGPLVSADNGVNWIDGTPFATSSGFGTIRFDGANFLCLASSNSGCPGPPEVIVTPDGNSYASQIATELNPFANLTDITKGGLLYALVDSAGDISTSPSSTWNGTLRASLAGVQLTGIAYGGSPAQFLAVAFDGSTVTSSDGITWTPAASAGSSGFFRVAFGDPFFTAVGPGGIWTFGPSGAG